MRYRYVAGMAALLAAVTITGLRYTSTQIDASSHREAPLISKDPSVDNTDLYAFRSPDKPDSTTLIANWIPFEEPTGGPNFYHFDKDARYLIKIDRDGDAVEDLTYEWTFGPPTPVNGNTFLYNTGPISNATDATFNLRQYYTVTQIVATPPLTTVIFANQLMVPDNIGPKSEANYPALAAQFVHTNNVLGISEFTGQREDPFFVDVGSIFDLGNLRPLNPAHVVGSKLPAAPGVDSTAGFNIHTTALQVPNILLAPTCTNVISDSKCVVGIWSTAERRTTTTRTGGSETGSGAFVQVSRLGNPLINEVVVPLALKDAFNSLPPTADSTIPAVVDKVLTPELASLMNLLYSGSITVPTTNRTDLVTVFLQGIDPATATALGISNFNTRQVNSGAKPSEQLRLNVAIPVNSAGVCKGNRLGVIGGDTAGFPNGRRLEDDVTDIALRVMAGILVDPKYNVFPNNALTDGVDGDDVACLSAFPYVGTPHDGYYRRHSSLNQVVAPIVVKSAAAGW